MLILGSFGNLSSAIVCAASSFSLTITDPASFIAEMDMDWFNTRYRPSPSTSPARSLIYTDPNLSAYKSHSKSLSLTPSAHSSSRETKTFPLIKSHIITLGDLIDTDALSPGSTLGICKTDADFAEHCLEHTHPDFRSQLKSHPYNGSAVVVAGKGFGVGSSRESAVSALKGCGVKCVIAKSFAFIFGRNCPSLGLVAVVMGEESGFWDCAWEGEGGIGEGREIEIDVEGRKVRVEVEGEWKEWGFELSEIEYQLSLNSGVTESFNRFGKGIWGEMMGGGGKGGSMRKRTGLESVGLLEEERGGLEKEMAW